MALPSAIHTGIIEADSDLTDEGYATSISESYLSTIPSSIRKGVEENGRLYPSVARDVAAFTPIDEAESERNNWQHYKFFILLDDRLHLSPLTDTPTDILDLGTGSGIWCIDIADRIPSANVIGVDLAPIQPSWIPSNCSFEVDDIERDWLWRKDQFDLIHGRELMLAIRDWPRLFQQTLQHLKPGGYAEFAGSYPEIGCDDGTLPPDSAYAETGHIWFAIGDALGVSCRAPAQWKTLMEYAGFVDVQERIYKIPCNPWPKDPRLKKVGAFELVQYRDQVSGIFLRGFTRALGRSREEWEVTIAKARTEVADRKIHAYIKYIVVYGRRPKLASHSSDAENG